MKDPAVSLAIDNCFASKRWTRPLEWMRIIKDAGLTLVEASADTECDPLYMGSEYINDWISDVKRCSEKTGVQVVNLYSGHGTYATLGLAHTDERVRRRFRDDWIKKQAFTAQQLNAGLGFFAHAISDPALQDPDEYMRVMDTLIADLADISLYATQIGLGYISVEQMYSPNQPPWTIQDAKSMLKKIFQISKSPFYLTIDLGHMNGQSNFQKPSPEQIADWIVRCKKGLSCKRMWLGPKRAMDIFQEAIRGTGDIMHCIKQIQLQWEGFDYLFAGHEDGSVYRWLQELGGYSPIIHLQQSDGSSSPHWPFSDEYNEIGIIKAEKVLLSISKAFSKDEEEGMPPLSDDIVLTLEPFVSTAESNYDALNSIAQSVQYWRKYVPYDGIPISKVLMLLNTADDI
jgi:sugar phosphate isomerase/epimerase